MLTVEEVKNFLEVEQKELERYLRAGKLHAYKIGGTYLRFRKDEVMNLRFDVHPKKVKSPAKVTFFSRLTDFWRFNNFYILSLVLVVLIIVLMVGF